MSSNALIQKPAANISTPVGTIVFPEGEAARHLILLQKGKVSILLSASNEDPSNKIYLYSLQAPAVLGGLDLSIDGKYSVTAITEADSVLSIYPSSAAHLEKIFASKPNIASMLLKTSLMEIQQLQRKRQKVKVLLHNLFNVNSSLSLAFARILPEPFAADAFDADPDFADPVIEFAKRIAKDYRENGGVLPNPITSGFLASDHHSMLTETEDVGGINHDDASYTFFSKFVSLPPEIIGAIAVKDVSLLTDAAKSLSALYYMWQDWIAETHEKSLESVSRIVSGEFSWLEKIALQADLLSQGYSKVSKNEILSVASFFGAEYKKSIDSYRMVWGHFAPFYNENNFMKIMRLAEEQNSAVPQPAPIDEPAAMDFQEQSAGLGFEIPEELENSFRKICEWVGIEEHKISEYENFLKQLKNFANPVDSKDDVRKIRRRVNLGFWEVYKKAAVKAIHHQNEIPRIIEMFLNFGYMDEEMLEPDQIAYIYNLTPKIKSFQSKYPIFYPLQWLTKIYNKEVTTSINELGLTYFELLRQDTTNREQKWKKESELPPELAAGEKMLEYEIQNMMEVNSRLTSGSILNNLNILNKFQITQKLENTFVSPEKLDAEIDKLLSLDYSAFHREVLFSDEKIGIRREFVQKQIFPNFIIVPSVGPIIQFWMDREPKERLSPGRLTSPAFHMADLFTMLISVVGIYRWETLKSQLGPDWNNISSSSLTADYTDYVQFFKKNKDLSPEMKEKLGDEFKRFRDDRARFVHDYGMFIRFESEGTQRLNKVARKILTKHIPLTPEVRERLIKLPAYTELLEKSKNVRARKLAELRPRYQKYERDNNGFLPQELKDNVTFFSK